MRNNLQIINSKPILVLLAGRTFAEISKTEGDFDDWIAESLGDSHSFIRMDVRTVNTLPAHHELAGVVVSGSHAMVTDRLPWSEQLAQWLKIGVDKNVPMLGICYGHQLLAHACGGVVDYHPKGIEVGTRLIELTETATQDLLFASMPKQFPAQLVHSQSVLMLPKDAALLAGNEYEPHQAFRIGKCAWGVQFHPEFSAQVMRDYIQHMEPKLLDKHYDIQALTLGVAETPDANLLLRRFADLC